MRTLHEGEILCDRYTIRRFVARGGMGEVYEAMDSVLDEIVALKTLTLTSLDDSHAAERLIHEVRMARRLVHPNVSRILETGIHKRDVDGSRDLIPFLTMEFLSGGTLAQRVRTVGRLAPTEVARLAGEICAGLEEVHAVGIVHRDLKSDNIFLAKDSGVERAVVMDFGLARAAVLQGAARVSSAGLVVGTAAYMAPEQILGEPPAVSFDIFALGVVLFEMLTGRLPFEGDTALSSAAMRIHAEVPRPSSLAPEVSAAWDALVLRCLRRAPGARFGSAADVARAIAAMVPVPVRQSTARRFRATRLAILLLVATGITGVLSVLSADETRPRAPARSGGSPPRTTPARAPGAKELVAEPTRTPAAQLPTGPLLLEAPSAPTSTQGQGPSPRTSRRPRRPVAADPLDAPGAAETLARPRLDEAAAVEGAAATDQPLPSDVPAAEPSPVALPAALAPQQPRPPHEDDLPRPF